MKFDIAIDAFIADWRGYGQINSPNTERAYREKLLAHAEDCEGRPVTKTGKNDVKKTLRRWEHPNSKNHAHSVLTAFYDWTIEEDIRTTNPARAVRRAKKVKPKINRLTKQETTQILQWLATPEATLTERWTGYLGICAGLRCQELCLIEKQNVSRPGFIHVPRSAGKGRKERFIPIVADLQPVIEEMIALGPDRGPLIRPKMRAAWENEWADAQRPFSRVGMYRMVKRIGVKAGLYQPITPHTLRHCFGDFIAKHSGLRVAQALLGHESVETTAGTYTDRVSLDEMQVAVTGFTFFSEVPGGMPLADHQYSPRRS